MNDQNKADPINVLFKTEVLDLADGSKVEVKPLSLEKLPHVLDALSKLMMYVDKGAGPSQIASVGFKEVVELIPHCIDRIPDEIPMEAVPDIVDVIIAQNLTESSIKKWKSLASKVIDLGEKVRGTGSSPSS